MYINSIISLPPIAILVPVVNTETISFNGPGICDMFVVLLLVIVYSPDFPDGSGMGVSPATVAPIVPETAPKTTPAPSVSVPPIHKSARESHPSVTSYVPIAPVAIRALAVAPTALVVKFKPTPVVKPGVVASFA